MAHSGDDAIPLLSGTLPGLVDLSQPSRLLRTATCNLYFASFDPHTARKDAFPNLSSLNLDPNSSKGVNLETSASTDGKRVVIETDPENGTCTWRFVPRAKLVGAALGDEGPWPRVVRLDGALVRMTQDQWDIYKLDPDYDCLVHALPNLTTITRISQDSTFPPDSTPVSEPPATPKMTQKTLDENTPTPRGQRPISPFPQTPPSSHMKAKMKSVDPDRMSIDEETFFQFFSVPAPSSPADEAENNKKRRRSSERLGDSSSDSGSSKPKNGTGPSNFPQFGRRDGNDPRGYGVSPVPAKRTRTQSPETARRDMEQKRLDREKKRKADMDARFRARQNAMHQAFWKDIGVAPQVFEEPLPQRDETDDSEAGAGDDRSSTPTECDDIEEAERLAQIEESRRKLAALEQDKPLWEESARRRREREAEEEWQRKQAKARKEEEERAQERLRAAKKQRDQQWEQERKARERDASIREQSGRMFVTQPCDTFRWNVRLALERYLRAAAAFDAAKFTAAAKPLSFAQVPWPVLHASFSVQEIDWDAVEAFFTQVQRVMEEDAFKTLVGESHKRFHPDRWRSRGLLVSVQNETERDLLEVAGSTVAQALTPLWKEVTGRI